MDLKFQFEGYVHVSFPGLHHWITKLLHLRMKITARNSRPLAQLKATVIKISSGELLYWSKYYLYIKFQIYQVLEMKVLLNG